MANNNTYASPLDESLQSYLFRILKLNGFYNYSSIIVSHSGWGNRPSIPFEAKHLLTGVNKSHLLLLLENSVNIPKDESDFINHFDFIELFNKTFSPQKVTKSAGKGMNIHFCPHCMKEQMRNYGYSYFKSCWTNQLYCMKHSDDLLALKPSQLTRQISNLHKILRCEVDKSFTCHPKRNSHFNKTISDRTIKFSPCSKSQLINWVIQNSKYYPVGYTDILDYGLLTKTERKAFNVIKYRKKIESNWEEFYQQLTTFSHKELLKYINENMVFDHVKYQQNGINSKSKAILKSKTKNCNTCMRISIQEYRNCSKNSLIYLSHSITPFSRQHFKSCDSRHSDLRGYIYSHQEKLGARKGEIRVGREMETSKMYRQHGGKNGYWENLHSIFKRIGR
jgi:hypothetical protein